MTYFLGSEPDDDLLPILRKEAGPLEHQESRAEAGRWQAFKGGLISWWNRYILGYAWSDVERLKEAKLNDIESISEERRAGAVAKLAEARKLDAEAEKAYAEAEQLKLRNRERRLDLDTAYERLQEKIRRIENAGGRVVIEDLADAPQLRPAGDAEQEEGADES